MDPMVGTPVKGGEERKDRDERRCVSTEAEVRAEHLLIKK